MKELLRKGQLYYIKRAEDIDVEKPELGKPVVILCADQEIIEKNGTVTVANITRRPRYDMFSHVTISSLGYKATAILEQQVTIDVNRFEKYAGEITKEELQEIDKVILRMNNLLDVDIAEYDNLVKEKDEEIARLKEELSKTVAKKSKWSLFQKVRDRKSGK